MDKHDKAAGQIKTLWGFFKKQRVEYIQDSTHFLRSLCVVISFFTTGSGVWNFVTEEGGRGGDGVFSWLVWFIVGSFVWGFVAVITFTMVWALNTWMSPTKCIFRWFVFVFWGVLFMISVSFSFAYFWEHTTADRAARSETAKILSSALVDLKKRKNTLNSVLNKSQTLRTRSQEKADAERNVTERVGACPGSPGAGDGPRAEMRDDFATVMKDLNEYLDKEINNFTTDVDALDEYDVSVLNSPENRSEQIKGINLALKDAKEKYSEIKNEVTNTDTIDSYTEWQNNFESTDKKFNYKEEQFSCHDRTMAVGLKAMISELNMLDDIPPPERLKDYVKTATRDAVLRGFDYFYHIYRPILNVSTDIKSIFNISISVDDYKKILAEKEALAKKLREAVGNGNADVSPSYPVELKAPETESNLKTDWLPLVLSLLVDIGLIIFSWSINNNKSLLDRVQPRLKPQVNIRDYLDELDKLLKTDQYKLISNHVIISGGRDFFVIPINRREPEQNRLLFVLRFLEARKVVSQRVIAFWKFVERDVKKQNRKLYKATRKSRFIYEIKPGAMYDILSSLSEKNPTSPDQNEEMDGEPTSPDQNEEMDGKPASPDQDEEMDGEPTSPDQNEEMDGEPTSPDQNEEMDGEPASPDQDEEMDGEPTSPNPNEEMDGEPTSPAQNEEMDDEPTSPDQNEEMDDEPTNPNQNEGVPEVEPSGSDPELPSGSDPKQPSGP